MRRRRRRLSRVVGHIRSRLSSIRQKLRLYGKIRELWLLTLVVAYVLADWWILVQFPPVIRNEVIASVTGIYIGVEGVLIGLAPQIKTKQLRDAVATLLGIPGLLLAVGTFTRSTFETVQLGYLSFLPTTLLFHLASAFFLGLVEAYAIAILFPIRRDPFDVEPEWQVT